MCHFKHSVNGAFDGQQSFYRSGFRKWNKEIVGWRHLSPCKTTRHVQKRKEDILYSKHTKYESNEHSKPFKVHRWIKLRLFGSLSKHEQILLLLNFTQIEMQFIVYSTQQTSIQATTMTRTTMFGSDGTNTTTRTPMCGQYAQFGECLGMPRVWGHNICCGGTMRAMDKWEWGMGRQSTSCVKGSSVQGSPLLIWFSHLRPRWPFRHRCRELRSVAARHRPGPCWRRALLCRPSVRSS